MELCQDVLDGLSVLKDPQRVDTAVLDKISRVVIRSLSRQPEEDGRALNSNCDELDKAEQKLVAVALSTLYVEAARLNRGSVAESAVIKSLLEDCEIPSETIQVVVSNYESLGLRDQLSWRLNRLALSSSAEDSTPRLLDVDWRQEFIVKSKNSHHASQINYLISLKTDKSSAGGEEDIKFTCSLEDLQDLVSKVRECAKVVETTLGLDVAKQL